MIENSGTMTRIRMLFKGIVQGVGFRPYLYRCAQKFNLTGFVKNTSEGVILEVEGHGLDDFGPYVLGHLPPLSEVVYHDVNPIPVENSETFVILSSENTDKSDLLVPPDIAICQNCRNELADPSDRRYRYPFINCTDCGPRMTIIQDLPYDRPLTTMKTFPMCLDCADEYGNPLDRRYHAQPVSCYSCGPILSLFNCNTSEVETRTGNPLAPLLDAARLIKQGKVVAIKGLGGYHLACLASSDETVQRLRELKRREHKPFAMMAPLETIKTFCHVNESEEDHLMSSSAPILLLKPREGIPVSAHVAPGQSFLGFMVPYTPLHIVLLEEVGEPLVMTSANIADEPIIYKDRARPLMELADYILSHDRDIYLFADDSVSRVVDDRLYVIRRSRGLVPFPVKVPVTAGEVVVALGPMMKTTFTFIRGNQAVSGPHIGDTDTPSAIEAELAGLNHYIKLFSFKPEIVVIDKHPMYPNRLLAREFPGANVVEIQHHKAHVGALLAENLETGRIIGIAMDGTGYGDDGKIWGGEFFVGDGRELERIGHLKYLFLPSGDKSVKEPWRFALSMLVELYGADHQRVTDFAQRFGEKGDRQLKLINSGIHSLGVLTSSCGRVFDAACSILDIGHYNNFDGDLPSQFQTAAESFDGDDIALSYRYAIEKEKNITILDLLPMFRDIIDDSRALPAKAFLFHRTLAEALVDMAQRASEAFGINTVGLTGGVFQNTLLLRLTMAGLKAAGFRVLVHSRVPANDGGISLGQAYLAALQYSSES